MVNINKSKLIVLTLVVIFALLSQAKEEAKPVDEYKIPLDSKVKNLTQEEYFN
jgi:hypothetical protein